ncbi:TPA: hypothetical protein ACHWA6_001851 [Streptococcus suis]|nr:hypothetical protein [Streptococcus suis]NQL91683.1 hypothetical protein [Streptococcus suis]NQM08752.1 hypothetical protein [Streptococcus suis]NQM20379.1 hypothetical protein [Streptococcus suis]HEM4093673.1 hypothetical protein [Streptococcus suis]
MIEKISQETVNALTDIFGMNLETGQQIIRRENQELTRKYCLARLRAEGEQVKKIEVEMAHDYHEAYMEIEEMTDAEFEVLRLEILSLELPS